MKMKKIILVAALSLGIAGPANAQSSVYLTGSPLIRNTVYNTLAGTSVFDATPTITVYETSVSGAPSSATYMAFSGAIGGTNIIVQCDWSESEYGIADVVSNLSEVFIGASALNGLNNGTNLPSTFSTNQVDLAMADNDQAVSLSPSPTVPETAVCVVPFEFVRNNGWWTGTNVTRDQIYQALNFSGTNYTSQRALFNSNTPDTNDYVYIAGLDKHCGERVNAFGLAITGWGITNIPFQIRTLSGGKMIGEGNTGYTSGAVCAGTMGSVTTNKTDVETSATGFSAVAYLGISDAATAVANGATILSFNGIFESPTNVINGTYNFWGNEYVLLENSAPTVAASVYSKLVAEIPSNCDTNTAISFSNMQSKRNDPNTIERRN